MKADTDLRTADFDYELPPELIAQQPLPDRGASRLLIVRRTDRRTAGPTDRRTSRRDGATGRRTEEAPAGTSSAARRATAIDSSVLIDGVFTDLPSLIPPGDLLVINTTKVRHARLLGTRPSGAPAEVLLIHPSTNGTWLALGKPGSALRPGKRITLGDGVAIETVEILENGNRLVRFVGASAEDAIVRFGKLPLPPYITREPTAVDETRYQTVYAQAEGSVAAPTAGLHFTSDLLDALSAKGIMIAGLDLQVGPGTFKPIEVENPAEHPMHPEYFEIPARLAGLVERVREAGGAIWAVGTTVVRALESAANADGTLRASGGETSLMITPGYKFKVVDHLLTNFHLPRSTLLMLVSAFAGYELTMAAYHHAVTRRYRFYSYGDAMLIL